MRTAPLPVALTLPRARWVVWLAIWLALLGAVAPTVSHALLSARGGVAANLIEICTNAGPRWMVLPAGVLGDAAPSTQASQVSAATPLTLTSPNPADAGGSGTPALLEHCPFCLLMADRLTLPSAATPLFFAAPGNAVLPLPPFVSDLPARHFAAAQPRGPPAF